LFVDLNQSTLAAGTVVSCAVGTNGSITAGTSVSCAALQQLEMVNSHFQEQECFR